MSITKNVNQSKERWLPTMSIINSAIKKKVIIIITNEEKRRDINKKKTNPKEIIYISIYQRKYFKNSYIRFIPTSVICKIKSYDSILYNSLLHLHTT